jgi:hypothetical protein
MSARVRSVLIYKSIRAIQKNEFLRVEYMKKTDPGSEKYL